MTLERPDIERADIERIVREVLSQCLAPGSALTASLPVATTTVVATPAIDSGFALSDAVISVESLRAVPPDTKIIAIGPNAIVTPAAKDWCREKGITVQRGPAAPAASAASANASVPTNLLAKPDSASNASAPLAAPARPARLFVTGSVMWLKSLEKQLCPKQSRVGELQTDDAATVRAVSTAIRSGHTAALAIVSAPHSALWQSARDEALRPVVVGQWSDLADAIREVPTNVLIVSAKRWNVAGTSNIARHFLDHLRSRT
ncbi:MAG: hypothetical protein ACK5OB_14445 [Pirellula sp.]